MLQAKSQAAQVNPIKSSTCSEPAIFCSLRHDALAQGFPHQIEASNRSHENAQIDTISKRLASLERNKRDNIHKVSTVEVNIRQL